MWLLKKLSNGTTKYLISENKTYTVGRKNCDITLEDDASISRKHCTVYIAKQTECPFAVGTLTGVWLVDEQSKYGTYLKNNNEWLRIDSKQNKKLSHGCVIKFGLMENVWSLEFKPLVVCASGIPSEQKKKILSSLQLIDGFFKNVWCKECVLVIVNEITLTVKVVLALIHGIPIVTPNYVQKMVECVKNQLVLPKYEDYRPEIKEILLDKSLVSLEVNESRKELFKGKKFVIPTKKQLETLSDIIISAGGSAEFLSCHGKMEELAKDNIIVIQLPFNNAGIPEELNKLFKEISSFLKNKYGRRVVPECEIAQAVAYASTEKFCNPKSNWFNIRIGEQKEVDLGPVIVEETPTAEEVSRDFPVNIVPCSATVESEPLLQTSTQLQDVLPKDMDLLFNSVQEAEVSLPERKRAHSSDNLDHELAVKKARSEENINYKDTQAVRNTGSLQSQNSQNSLKETAESKSIEGKKNQIKSSYITNYFQKQNRPLQEKSRVVRQNNSDFWNCDLLNNYKIKRKISNESEDANENSNKKKAKLSEEVTSRQKTSQPVIEASAEVVEKNKNFDQLMVFSSTKKVPIIQEENDFAGFFEKEKMDTLNDLNSTLFSLTLISPAYLNEDGSLIDPPMVPVNVKRFKKQKIISSEMLNTVEENEEELLKGGWIEPHSNHHNISVAK